MKQIIIDGVTYNLVPVDEEGYEVFRTTEMIMTWDDALAYAKLRGMRLLRSEELHVLARDGHLPVKDGWAWSSSSVSDCTSFAWLVDLGSGYTDNYDKSDTGRVVCVAKDFDLATYLTNKGDSV